MAIERKNGPVRASHSLLCLELMAGDRKGEPRYTIILSLPGREGTVAHSWGRFGEFVDEQEITDMITYVQKTMAQGIIMGSGAQQRLEL